METTMTSDNNVFVKMHDPDMDPIEVYKNGDWVDLRSAECVDMKKGEFRLISLGVSMKLPEGYEAHLAVRSSTFKKFKIIQTNGIGIIDNSYCGDNDIWKLPVYAVEDTRIPYNERIAQFRIVKKQPKLNLIYTDYLKDQDRGGFGSTDEKEKKGSAQTSEKEMAKVYVPLDNVYASNFKYLSDACMDAEVQKTIWEKKLPVGLVFMPNNPVAPLMFPIGTVQNKPGEWIQRGVLIQIPKYTYSMLGRLEPEDCKWRVAPIFVDNQLIGFYITNCFEPANGRVISLPVKFRDPYTGMARPLAFSDIAGMVPSEICTKQNMTVDDIFECIHVDVRLPIHQSLPCSYRIGQATALCMHNDELVLMVPDFMVANLVTEESLELLPDETALQVSYITSEYVSATDRAKGNETLYPALALERSAMSINHPAQAYVELTFIEYYTP